MNKIRVALGGSEGKMGRVLQKLISETDDIELYYGIDPQKEVYYPTIESFLEGARPELKKYNVYIDFTNPDSVLDNVQKISEHGIDSEIGTTGWYDKLDEMEEIALSNKRRILYAPNFSIGVNALFHVTKELAEILGKYGYDGQVYELHHTGKKDSPSGTAVMLGNILKESIPKKKKLAYERRNKRNDDEIDVLGGRVGSVTGYHMITFSPNLSDYERLTLEHNAFNREVFANGAIVGIRWLFENSDKEPGLYTFKEDVLGL